MNLEGLGRVLVIFALGLLVTGGLFIILGKLGVFKLPGDVIFKRGSFTFFFPIVTGLAISIILTVVLNLAVWLWRR